MNNHVYCDPNIHRNTYPVYYPYGNISEQSKTGLIEYDFALPSIGACIPIPILAEIGLSLKICSEIVLLGSEKALEVYILIGTILPDQPGVEGWDDFAKITVGRLTYSDSVAELDLGAILEQNIIDWGKGIGGTISAKLNTQTGIASACVQLYYIIGNVAPWFGVLPKGLKDPLPAP